MLEDIQSLLKKRQLLLDPENIEKWNIRDSEINGKGVFANRDIKAGEFIFKEVPLIIGPRVVALPAACVSCLRLGVPLSACSGGCRLPVCGEACSLAHRPECLALTRRLPLRQGELWSPPLYRALAPIRCLLLPEQDRAIVRALCHNVNTPHLEVTLNNGLKYLNPDDGSQILPKALGVQIRVEEEDLISLFVNLQLLKEELSEEVCAEDSALLELSCRVLNSTAFEMELGSAGPAVSWRGLFPLAGVMNHSCCPNTQHTFEGDRAMGVLATRDLAAGQELTTGYCPLLWSTAARRHFLQLTKDFLCGCERCSDPTEFGTYFSGHACACRGYILPTGRGDWECRGCGRGLSAKEVLAGESAMLRGRLPSHPDSYLAVQARVRLIARHRRPYSDASDEELASREKAIKDVIDINDRLHLGQSRLKITLEEELHATLEELSKRKLSCTTVG